MILTTFLLKSKNFCERLREYYRKAAEVKLNEENIQKLKTLLEKTSEFAKLDKKFTEQLELDIPQAQADIIGFVYMNKILKSLDFHFLSKTDLNVVDKPEWMVNFIEEALFANTNFLLTVGLGEVLMRSSIVSFLNTFYVKLNQRFQQDSSFFLEHEFLFTNFLVCLNEHSYKVHSFLKEKNILLIDPEIYNLSKIYEGKSEYLEKMISGELREFEELIYEVSFISNRN